MFVPSTVFFFFSTLPHIWNLCHLCFVFSLFSTVALCKLLQHGLNTDDKRLQDIVVKGEEIYSPDEGIRTRSKSAKSKESIGPRDSWICTSHDVHAAISEDVPQDGAVLTMSSVTSLIYSSSTDPERWTNIPLLVKLFKLIINELSTVVESNASRTNPADWTPGEYQYYIYIL